MWMENQTTLQSGTADEVKTKCENAYDIPPPLPPPSASPLHRELSSARDIREHTRRESEIARKDDG